VWDMDGDDKCLFTFVFPARGPCISSLARNNRRMGAFARVTSLPRVNLEF